MSLTEYHFAQQLLDLVEYHLTSNQFLRGLITESEYLNDCEHALYNAIEAVHDVVHGAPDPRFDPATLIERARLLAAGMTRPMFDTHHESAADVLETCIHAWESSGPAREQMLLVALEWEQSPACTFESVNESNLAAARSAAALVVDTVRHAPDGCMVARTVHAGTRCYGPVFSAQVVKEYLAAGWADPRIWSAVECALDELGALAASTDSLHLAHHGRSSLARQARAALIDLADYPELTAVALARLPHHRLTSADLKALKKLVASRAEVFDDDLIEESEKARSIAGELLLMRALDAADALRARLS